MHRLLSSCLLTLSPLTVPLLASPTAINSFRTRDIDISPVNNPPTNSSIGAPIKPEDPQRISLIEKPRTWTHLPVGDIVYIWLQATYDVWKRPFFDARTLPFASPDLSPISTNIQFNDVIAHTDSSYGAWIWIQAVDKLLTNLGEDDVWFDVPEYNVLLLGYQDYIGTLETGFLGTSVNVTTRKPTDASTATARRALTDPFEASPNPNTTSSDLNSSARTVSLTTQDASGNDIEMAFQYDWPGRPVGIKSILSLFTDALKQLAWPESPTSSIRGHIQPGYERTFVSPTGSGVRLKLRFESIQMGRIPITRAFIAVAIADALLDPVLRMSIRDRGEDFKCSVFLVVGGQRLGTPFLILTVLPGGAEKGSTDVTSVFR